MRVRIGVVVLLHLATVSVATLRASSQPGQSNALPSGATGAQIYDAACAACHGPDGRGVPKPLLGFETPVRDFSDCTVSAEPTPDWVAVVHEGGPVRALDRHMPAFGDVLTRAQIEQVVDYLRTFCAEQSVWPQGDLNFPRAFFTEKAYPENEAVWTTDVATGPDEAVANTLLYERRIGARSQVELKVPIVFKEHLGQGPSGPWVKGIGDVAFGLKRVLAASMGRGAIASVGFEAALPTGNEYADLGRGYAVYEPYGAVGVMLPADGFLQVHGGLEIPSKPERAVREAFLRAAVGTTVAQDRGFGRAWSPQLELLWARPFGFRSEYDVVPQVQVSLSKLQHVLLSAGVRVPLNQRGERHPRVLVYLLWDWFDGGLFDFWK